jgi:hypothetical protein
MQLFLEKQIFQNNKKWKCLTLFLLCILPKNNTSLQPGGAQIANISSFVKFCHSKNLSYVLHLVLQDTKKRQTNYCPLYIDLTFAKHHNLMISRTKVNLPWTPWHSIALQIFALLLGSN